MIEAYFTVKFVSEIIILVLTGIAILLVLVEALIVYLAEKFK